MVDVNHITYYNTYNDDHESWAIFDASIHYAGGGVYQMCPVFNCSTFEVDTYHDPLTTVDFGDSGWIAIETEFGRHASQWTVAASYFFIIEL